MLNRNDTPARQVAPINPVTNMADAPFLATILNKGIAVITTKRLERIGEAPKEFPLLIALFQQCNEIDPPSPSTAKQGPLPPMELLKRGDSRLTLPSTVPITGQYTTLLPVQLPPPANNRAPIRTTP